MPVYNAEKYLSQSIESILNQTYEKFEFIIVDDASTDNSWKIIRSYAKKDKRIIPIKNRINLGVSLTSNIAMSLAHGKFLARMDADDISFSQRIEKQFDFLKHNSEVIAVGTQCVVINSDDQVIGYKKFPTEHESLSQMSFWAIPLQQPSMMINLKKLPKNFKWYEPNKSSAEDVDIMFRFMLYGQIRNLPENLLFYRHLDNSLSHKDPKATFNLTIKSRLAAINLGFTPTFKAVILNLCQIIAVNLIPGNLINELWYRIRGIKNTPSNLTAGNFTESKV
jgi:glycosyltransferase involved in cell wall biosynthesis